MLPTSATPTPSNPSAASKNTASGVVIIPKRNNLWHMKKTVKHKESETITEGIFRTFYGANTFIEKSAIPHEYDF
ncbi:hypothetical protein ELC62_30480, partial [Klebsiella pneumoniae]|nr:hypothetical protein [Klebsiella pneumoniae]